MIENIKAYSKIAALSFFKWMLISASGIVVSLVLMTIAILQHGHLASGNGNAGSFIPTLFRTNFPAFILLFGAPLFIFLYIVIANKYTIQLTISQIWKNKAEGFVGEKMKLIVDKLVSKNKTLTSITNESVLRLKLLEENRSNPDSSKIKRKVTDYIIKKIRLDDIDYTDKDLRLSDIISNKVNSFISEKAAPSLLFFWILLLVQVILFIVSQFL